MLYIVWFFSIGCPDLDGDCLKIPFNLLSFFFSWIFYLNASAVISFLASWATKCISSRSSICSVTSDTMYIHHDFHTLSIMQCTSLSQERVRIKVMIYLSNVWQAWATEMKEGSKCDSPGQWRLAEPYTLESSPLGLLKNKNQSILEAQTKAQFKRPESSTISPQFM